MKNIPTWKTGKIVSGKSNPNPMNQRQKNTLQKPDMFIGEKKMHQWKSHKKWENI